MKILAVISVIVLLLSSFPPFLQGAHEGDAGEEHSKPTKTEEHGMENSPCTYSLSRLRSFFEELFGREFELYINCLSFDAESALERGVLSVFNRSEETNGGSGTHGQENGLLSPINETCATQGGSRRVNLLCVEGVIVTSVSNLPPVKQDINSTGTCLHCDENANENAAICIDPCLSPCERCFGKNTTCTQCLKYRVLDSYHEAEEFEEIPHDCDFHPELEKFTCSEECTIAGHEPNEELNHTCFACGLEFCVECRRVEPHNICVKCLENTVLFEGECFKCPLAITALIAEEQEHELEEEEDKNRIHQIQLAVILPIVCLLIIIFFVGMSFIAHYRYPHINEKGHKRHRNKPTEFDNDNIVPENDADDQPLSPTNVWRPRPTVRLR